MRLTIAAALVMVGLPVVVGAQSRPPTSGIALGVALPLPAIGLPLPALASPLPPIGLPLSTIAVPSIDSRPRVEMTRPWREIGSRHPESSRKPSPVTIDRHREFSRKPSPVTIDRHRQFSRKPSVPTVVYVVPAYDFGYFPLAQAGTPNPGYFPGGPTAHQEERPLIGTLRFELQPEADVQLYVDGYYVGTPADVSGEIELEAGRHSIEIRASGYETAQFDVNITPNRSITYQGSLKRASMPPPAGPTIQPLPDLVPRTPTTFYLIPGCYAGNVPPKDAGLPATCDPSQVISFKR